MIVNPRSELLREPNLLLPGKKPLGPIKIDPTHPLVPDIEAAWIQVVGNQLRDLTGKYVTPDINLSTPNGNHLSFNGGTDGCGYDERPIGNGDRTLMVKFRAESASDMMPLLAMRVAADPYALVSLQCNGYINASGNVTPAAGEISAFCNPTPIAIARSDATIVDGGWHTVIAVFEEGSAIRLFSDGQNVTDSTAQVYQDANSYNANQHTELGGMADLSSAGNALNGDIEMALLLTTAITDEQAILLSKDPYQFLIPA